MAAEVLAKQAIESSTYVVKAAFTDEDGGAVVPDTLKWTLTNDAGTVINGRENVVIGAPATDVDILLKAADLAPGGDDVAKLLLTVNATYTSGLGAALPLIAQCWILLATQEPSD